MYGAILMLLCLACIQDVRTGKISNLLVVSVAITGGFYAYYLGQWSEVLRWFMAILVYFIVCYPLFKIGVLGGGDVKLMSVVAGVFSWEKGLDYFVLVWLVAGLMALAKMLSEGDMIERLEYFFSYVRDVVVTGRWQFYHRESVQERGRRGTVCMSLPMLVGFVLCMGG